MVSQEAAVGESFFFSCMHEWSEDVKIETKLLYFLLHIHKRLRLEKQTPVREREKERERREEKKEVNLFVSMSNQEMHHDGWVFSFWSGRTDWYH